MPGKFSNYDSHVQKFNDAHGVNFSFEQYETDYLRKIGLASLFGANSDRTPENTIYKTSLLLLYRSALENKINGKTDQMPNPDKFIGDFEYLMNYYRSYCSHVNQTPPAANGGWKDKTEILEAMKNHISDIKPDKSDYAKDKYLAGKLRLRDMRANLETMRTEGMTAERLSNTIVHARALEKTVRERSGWWKVMPWNWARNRAEQKELRSLNEFIEAAQTENSDLCEQAASLATENVIGTATQELASLQESIKLAKETNVSAVENVEKEPLNLDPNLGEVVKQEQISERQQEAHQKTNDLQK